MWIHTTGLGPGRRIWQLSLLSNVVTFWMHSTLFLPLTPSCSALTHPIPPPTHLACPAILPDLVDDWWSLNILWRFQQHTFFACWSTFTSTIAQQALLEHLFHQCYEFKDLDFKVLARWRGSCIAWRTVFLLDMDAVGYQISKRSQDLLSFHKKQSP